MADPIGGLQLSHGIAAAVGAAILGAGRILWGALTASQRRESDAKDVLIATLRAELAHEREERTRERYDAVAREKRLGEKCDALRDQRERDLDKAAGVFARMRLDPSVDETKFEPDMPTAVRDRAELMAPKNSTPPKGFPAPTGRYRGPRG